VWKPPQLLNNVLKGYHCPHNSLYVKLTYNSRKF
jgi:hypothetical protein